MSRVQQRHLERLLERGDHGAFIEQLEPMCNRLVNRTASKLEREDLMQEARLACLKVARTWRPDGGANPLSLAMRVVQRELWHVSRREEVEKRRATNEAVSLSTHVGHADGTTELGDLLPARGPDVQDEALARAELDHLLLRVEVECSPGQREAIRRLVADEPLDNVGHAQVSNAARRLRKPPRHARPDELALARHRRQRRELAA